MTCSDCGGPISEYSKTGRCQPCAAGRTGKANAGEANGNWKGALAASRTTNYSRTHRLFPLDGHECETPSCTELATDRHHQDESTANNVRSNIEFLCRSCHLKEHYRRGRFVSRA